MTAAPTGAHSKCMREAVMENKVPWWWQLGSVKNRKLTIQHWIRSWHFSNACTFDLVTCWLSTLLQVCLLESAWYPPWLYCVSLFLLLRGRAPTFHPLDQNSTFWAPMMHTDGWLMIDADDFWIGLSQSPPWIPTQIDLPRWVGLRYVRWSNEWYVMQRPTLHDSCAPSMLPFWGALEALSFHGGFWSDIISANKSANIHMHNICLIINIQVFVDKHSTTLLLANRQRM